MSISMIMKMHFRKSLSRLVMRAHRSNFQILGFTSEPTLTEIVEVSHQVGVPVIDDLGSGSLLDTSEYGLGHEPMVQRILVRRCGPGLFFW